jgi:hypothetical protein
MNLATRCSGRAAQSLHLKHRHTYLVTYLRRDLCPQANYADRATGYDQ